MGDHRGLMAWSKLNQRVAIGQRRALKLEASTLF
jgi:hypothetical protein